MAATEKQFIQALEQHEFSIHYQPQISLDDGALIGMEALLRWNSPEHGLLTPTQFLPALEETGFMLTLGRWVLREVCMQNKTWQDAGHPPLTVAVNISTQELRHKDFVSNLRQMLDDTGLAPHWLKLEIRETSIEENEALALEQLQQAQALGVRIALDNLGNSHLPLKFLTRLPIHSIKIARSVISNIDNDMCQAAIVKAVIAMTRVLNIKGMAAGVERQEQLNFLKNEHCDDAQGFLLGKPMPASACIDLFSAHESNA